MTENIDDDDKYDVSSNDSEAIQALKIICETLVWITLIGCIAVNCSGCSAKQEPEKHTSFLVIPSKLLEPCPVPSWQDFIDKTEDNSNKEKQDNPNDNLKKELNQPINIPTNQDLIEYIVALKHTLNICNADKKALSVILYGNNKDDINNLKL